MALTNQTNPKVDSLKIGNGKAGHIYSGSATTSATIDAAVGSPNAGDLYISTNGSGEIWFALQADLGNEWTQLTIN